MTAMAQLIAYDRIIESAVALPGAMAAPATAAPEWQVAVEDLAQAPPFAAQCAWREGQLVWSISQSQQYLVRDRQLLVRHRGAQDALSVSENAIANGLPALAWLAGDIVLHAAAVVMPGADRAIAIMAPSGGGKSTLLSELMQAGASLLADDTLVLRREGRHWIGSGLAGGWFTRSDCGSERRFSVAPVEQCRRRAMIGAIICLLLTREAPVDAVQPITGMAAITALLNHRHRALVARAIGSEPANLDSFAGIAASVPMVTMARQWGSIGLTAAELAAMAGLSKHRW